MITVASRDIRGYAPGLSRSMLFALLFVIVGYGASPATADECPKAGSEIETDRPDATNTSVAVPEGSFQVENGVNLTSQNNALSFDGANTRLRFGVAHCFEVFVDLPTYFTSIHGHANSGFSDVAPAVKWQVNPLPGKFDFAVIAGMGLPTGAKSISGPGVQPYLQLPWSRDLDDEWSIGGQATFFFQPSDPISQFTTESTFEIQKKIGKKITLFVEYAGEYPDRGSPSQFFDTGAAYRITPLQQVDFHFNSGLNSNTPNYSVGVGYSFRLDRVF